MVAIEEVEDVVCRAEYIGELRVRAEQMHGEEEKNRKSGGGASGGGACRGLGSAVAAPSCWTGATWTLAVAPSPSLTLLPGRTLANGLVMAGWTASCTLPPPASRNSTAHPSPDSPTIRR
jgi:hypothetical protein